MGAGEALIVAACGEPSRRRVCGLDPVLRAVLAGQQSGLQHVVVVAAAGEHALWSRRLVDHPRLRLRLLLLTPEEALARGSGLLPDGAEEAVVACADTIRLPALLRTMLPPLAASQRAALASAAAAVEVGAAAAEVGAAAAEVGAAAAEQFAGLARVGRASLPAVLPGLLQGSNGLHLALQGLGGSPAALERRPVAPGTFVRLQHAGDEARAERMLLRSLVKPADGVISRHINRKLSLSLSRWLARTPLRPNHVTAVVLLLGLASGPLAARGDHLGFALGGLLYYLAAILDGCDGELSRLKHLGSPLGTWFDTVTDDLSALSFLAGLYWGLARSGSSFWLWLGGVAVAGNLLTVLLRYHLLLRLGTGDHQQLAAAASPPTGGPSARRPSALGRAVRWVKQTIVRTDFLPFAAFVTCTAGVPWVFAVPYPAGALAAVVDTLLLYGRRPR